jgi:hypothetical protein
MADKQAEMKSGAARHSKLTIIRKYYEKEFVDENKYVFMALTPSSAVWGFWSSPSWRSLKNPRSAFWGPT